LSRPVRHSFVSQRSEAPRRSVTVLAVFAGLAAPLGLHLLSGRQYTMPYRAMVAAPYAIWLVAALAMYARFTWLRYASVLLTCGAAFQILNAHANYSAGRSLALAHDRDLAAAVYQRITQAVPTMERSSNQKVDFYGSKPFSNPYPWPFSSTIGRY